MATTVAFYLHTLDSCIKFVQSIKQVHFQWFKLVMNVNYNCKWKSAASLTSGRLNVLQNLMEMLSQCNGFGSDIKVNFFESLAFVYYFFQLFLIIIIYI